MPKILEEDSDSDFDIKTDNEYAKNYDNWRKKEELNKLKTKYGEDSLHLLEDDSSSTSSDDDDDAIELNEEIEKQFFKTLSCLKNKDPRIYDENVKFFDEALDKPAKNKEKREKPMYIKDYERELILTKNGELSESDEEEDPRAQSPTYVEEQRKIKENLKKALDEVGEDDDGGDWGGVLRARRKTEEEKIKEEADYKEWLAGQKDQIDDKEAESELKPLKDYWCSPNLDDGEKFLRDYILQKKFLSKDDEDYIPTYEEIVHDSDQDLSEDEEAIEKQEEFEHKYNFRFEEPDQEFIKRYPRTVEQSLRKTDDRRKLKRAETKERKQKEKQQKMQELKKLQELKHKEIEEKIQKLKEITGNKDIGFKDEDLDGDFDPEAHDRRMQSLFNDEFYQGPEDTQKPEFPELDEYLELENWEKWKAEEGGEDGQDEEEHAPHCEDDDFNMDCDYDPTAAVKEELIENSKGKKKRKRKSLFAKALSQPKPVFDPNDKTYEEYLDEYYKLDCEDIIGDMPCKFKYRKVVPNDFGLTIEEILTAKDRELNKWCSLKKAVQIRPDHVEKYDQIAFAKKASNVALKRKILPSLFEKEQSDDLGGSDRNGKKKTNTGKTTNGLIIKTEEEDPEIPKDRKGPASELTVIKTEAQELEIPKNGKGTANELIIKTEEQEPEISKKTENTNKNKKKKKKRSKRKTNITQIKEEKPEVPRKTEDTDESKKKKKKAKNKSDNNPGGNKTERKEENISQQTKTTNGEASTSNTQKRNALFDRSSEMISGNTTPNKRKNKKAKKTMNNSVDNKNIHNGENLSKKRKYGDRTSNEFVPKKKLKKNKGEQKDVGISDARLSAYGINPKKFKNKLKYKKSL